MMIMPTLIIGAFYNIPPITALEAVCAIDIPSLFCHIQCPDI
jgi:hypothetical protein